MPIIPNIYLQVRDGQTYAPKLLDPGVVGPITWDYQEQGGLAQIKATLLVSWDLTGIVPGDYLEVWVLGEMVPRARGIVSTPEASLDLKETKTVIAMGRMADMDKVLDDKVIFHPSGSPQDLSYYAAELLSDYQQRKAVSTAVAPPLDIDVQPTGSNMESLGLTPGSVRSGMDTLYSQAGGNVVWGWDIHPVTGNDRFYLRLRTSAIGFQCFVGDKVKLIVAPSELVPVTNGAYLKGGAAKFPNLLTNASFEQPTNPTADSGSLLQNGGFELGHPGQSSQDAASGNNDVLAWSLSPTASRNQHDPGSNHNASAHTGDWYLMLDSPSDWGYQEAAVTAGTAYLATVFVRAENGQHLPTGVMTITGRDASDNVTETPSGAVLALAPSSTTWSGGAASAIVGSDALQTSLVFANPATVKARITLSCTSASAGFGLCIDDVTFGPVGAVGQYGWSTHLQNPGNPANAFNSILWACKAAAWDGAYGVRASVTADFSNKPVLAPAGGDNSGASQFHFKPGDQQSLQCGFFARMTPGQNSQAGAVRAAYREWAGDGHETQDQYSHPGSAWTPNIPNDGQWHLVVVNISAHGDASTATTQAEFGVSGVYDLDGFFVMDAAHPVAQAQDPLSANYLRGADFERYVTAESVCTSGSPADLAASASHLTWGRREALVTNDQIIDWTPDAASYMQAYFQRAAVLQERPRVELTDDFADIVLPGDGTQVQVSGTAADLLPQWVSHALYSWAKSSLNISLDLSNERPTWAKLLKAASASGGSAGSSAGAPSGGGQTGATTPAPPAVSSVNAKVGAVVLAAGDVGAEPALGDPAADGYVLSSTAAGVRSWTQPPAGTGGSAATAAALGTVKTDITESGGSVVYTKTTMDSLLAGKISVGAALAESEITGLLTDLSNKITVGAALSESEITNLVSDLAGKIAAGTALPESEITGLVSDLAGKIASGTALPESEITNLAADLAARIAVVGTPADGQVPTWVAAASQYQPKTPAGTGGISITESIGNGADLALSTAYQTVPTISISLGANAAVDADALVEIVADAANGYDDVYLQLYDALAAAPVSFSERHVSHIAAGKRGQIALSKYVAGTPAGRTLVLQAKNGTAARGTLNTNRSLLQTLGVGSGTSSGGGITSPTQISGLTVWLNAGAITGAANGMALASWADSSGNGHSAAQATAGSQPLYIASGLNGKPVVRFNGTSQFMTLGDLSAALPAAASLFLVATYNGTQNQVLYSTSPYNSSTQAGDDFSYFQSNGGSYWSVFTTPRTPTYGGTMPSTGSNLFSLVSGPSAWELWVNQADKGAVSSTFAPGTNHLLGHSNNAANAVYLSGDISELLIYSAALSTTDRQNVEGYLKSKYGI